LLEVEVVVKEWEQVEAQVVIEHLLDVVQFQV